MFHNLSILPLLVLVTVSSSSTTTIIGVSSFTLPTQAFIRSVHKMSKLSTALTAVTKDDLLGAQDMIDTMLREKACGTWMQSSLFVSWRTCPRDDGSWTFAFRTDRSHSHSLSDRFFLPCPTLPVAYRSHNGPTGVARRWWVR